VKLADVADLPVAELKLVDIGPLARRQSDEPIELVQAALILVDGEPVAQLRATKAKWKQDYGNRLPTLTLTVLGGEAEISSRDPDRI
jgi:hypothetical protein